ncbi:MAG TPA: TonB-dependent receptor [Bacteroidota bacterium]|nr:TonB-dependent receptor [Bacteroidota bacterium]
MSHIRVAVFAALCVCIELTAIVRISHAATVTGRVVSSQAKKSIPMVNVAILDPLTNGIVTGAVTDAEGRFRITDVPPGRFVAKASIVGYTSHVSTPFTIDSVHRELALETFTLTETGVKLNEVTITSTKNTLTTAIDRKVYNVQQDVLSKSGTASDLLQNIPSVQVDLEGNVSLRGSTDVMILINGKKSALMGANRADVLQQMPASSIERIEVITNPSAKYKPDGTSGIINIVMKKEMGTGLNGTIAANAGNRSRYNANASFNYNPGTYNIFGSLSHRQDDRSSVSSDIRTQRDASSIVSGYYDDRSRSFSRPSSQVAALGAEYLFDESNSAGISGSYHYRGFTRTDVSSKLLRDQSQAITEQYERVRFDPEYERESEMNAFYQHAFSGEDHTLRLEFKQSHQPEQEDNQYTNTYRIPAPVVQHDNTRVTNIEDQSEATAEYSYKIDEKNSIEAGYAGEFNARDMDYLGTYFDAQRSQFVIDAVKTNRFMYDETIHAAYVTYETGAGAFSVLGGLRAEQAFIKANLASRDSLLRNEYLYLYPTLHLGYRFSPTAELQLNYSRRAHRPEGDDLNPFPEYQDPRNVRAGNPHLRPELIHSVEFGCQLQNDNLSVIPSLFYRNAYDRLTSVTEALNDSTLLTTLHNLSSEQSAGIELVASGSISSVVSANLSVNSFYEQIDASNLGFSAKKSTWTWSGSMNCNITLPFALMLQLNSNYRSARLTPQGENRPSFVMNAGVRQDLFDERVSVVFTVSDIFNTLSRKNMLDTPWLSQASENHRDSQILYLGIAYHFGQPSKKTKEKSLQYDEAL